MTNITLKDLVEKVQAWGDDKKITSPENIDKQYMKFIEEVLEFKTEMDLWTKVFTDSERERLEVPQMHNIKMEMGDILVTLIIMAKQKGYDFVKMYKEAKSSANLIRDDMLGKDGEKAVFLELVEAAIDLKSKGFKEEDFELILIDVILLNRLLNSDLIDCLSMAYDKIKDRKGVTRDGQFIKKEDL